MKNNYIGIALIALIVVAGFIVYEKLPNTNQKTISSSGTATIKVMPDEASVYVSIETLNDSAQTSKDENSRISNNVLTALHNLGINDSSIETSSYNIYPDYSWGGVETVAAGSSGIAQSNAAPTATGIAQPIPINGQKFLGYRTTNILRVKLTDFSLVGKVVDASVNAGANGINNIDFELSNAKQEEAKKEALANASLDARQKADAIASGLGTSIKGIVSVSDTGYNYVPYPLYAKGGAVSLEQATTSITPSELEVTANVNVVFEI